VEHLGPGEALARVDQGVTEFVQEAVAAAGAQKDAAAASVRYIAGQTDPDAFARGATAMESDASARRVAHARALVHPVLVETVKTLKLQLSQKQLKKP